MRQSIGAVAAALFFVLSVLLFTTSSRAATYTVGAGKTYADLAAVAPKLAAGDLVLVDGNATYGSVLFTKPGTAASPVTIRGVTVAGKRPHLAGGTNTIEAQADHYVFENLEISGGSSRCFFHHADDIVIRGSVIHDCPKQGILGADNDSGSLLLEFTEVYKCGGGTFDHQIYMATDEAVHPGSIFRMQHCWVHDGNGGNNVKSRAERNEIYYNWIEGALYHELELIGPDPAGGIAEGLKREDSDVEGNVLRKTNTAYVVRFGGDGTGQTNGRYRFVNNTVIVNAGGSAVFRLFDGIDSLEAHNNVFYAVGGGPMIVLRDSDATWVSGPQIVGNNNWAMTGSTVTRALGGASVTTIFPDTIFGTDPKFNGFATYDYKPAAGSPLVDKGGPATASPTGHAFPKPLSAPLFMPPARMVAGAAIPRPVASVIDIGAYEFGSGPPADGGVTDSGPTTDTGAPPGDGSIADTDVTGDTGAIGATDGAVLDTGSGLDGSSGDGGNPADGATADSAGCGCSSPGASSAAASLGAGVLVALLGVVTRRRRRVQRP